MRAFLDKIAIDTAGTAVVEFAFALPVLILFIFGTLQIGNVALVKTGLQHSVGEAARYSTIFPTPTDAQIIAKARERSFGMDPASITLSVKHGVNGGVKYADVSGSYQVPLDFGMFALAPATITQTQRGYLP